MTKQATGCSVLLSLLILALQNVSARSADAHAGHDHHNHGQGGDEAFEWAGVFQVPETTYVWTAQKVKRGSTTQYADATMKMAVLPASAATEAKLHALETEGEHSLEMNCTNVSAGGIITPAEDTCFQLHFKEEWWQSLFTIDATGHSALAFFTEHSPKEFERTAHYLKDDHGHDIEPVAELPEVTSVVTTPVPVSAVSVVEEDDHWGPAMGAAVAVNFITLLGVIFMVPVLSRGVKAYASEFECVASGFAAGAISACAFFLLLFESTHLIASAHSEEVDQNWRWGTMILAGVLLPTVVHVALEAALPGDPALTKSAPETESEGVKPNDVAVMVPTGSRFRLISSVLFGDFMHNLCDGFFIAAAFKGCGSSFGWTVASGTIAHEVAQELSDYVVLTGDGCRLRSLSALGLNFFSGMGVLLGVIIVLSAEVSDGDIGLLLAFGGGAYLHIALVECMPKLHTAKVSGFVRALGVTAFIVGAVAMGLVLLDHEHCVPPSPPGTPPAAQAQGHQGHGH